MIGGRNAVVKGANQLIGNVGEVLHLHQALKRGEMIIDVKNGVRGFDNLSIKPNGNSVDVFLDEVKNVSGRVNRSSNAPTALGVGGARGTQNLADNLTTAQTRLTEAFNRGKLLNLTAAQFETALSKLSSGDVTVRFVGSGRTQFSQQTLIREVSNSFRTENLITPQITFGRF